MSINSGNPWGDGQDVEIVGHSDSGGIVGSIDIMG
jgi:hypothetical protein